MKLIKHNDYIHVLSEDKSIKGFYKGKEDNYIKIDENKIPLESIQAIDFERDLSTKSISEQIRSFKEMLNERNGVDKDYGTNLLPRGKWGLSIDASPYELYRAILKMGDPEMYSEPSGNFGYTDSMMTFHNPIEYENVKKFLKQFGYNFTEIGNKNSWTEKDHDPNNNSPYPKNVHDEDF